MSFDFPLECSRSVLVTSGLTENEGERHTLGLVERLRAEFKDLWGTSSKLHFRREALLREPADPHLRDIPTDLPFRVESGIGTTIISWVISASSSVAIAHAALDVAIANYPASASRWQRSAGNPRV
jgi:hypothetical protein